MTAKHISDGRQRHSKRYLTLHALLRAEIAAAKAPEPDKRDRKRTASQQYRQQGAT